MSYSQPKAVGDLALAAQVATKVLEGYYDLFGNSNYQGGANNGDLYTAGQMGTAMLVKVEAGSTNSGTYNVVFLPPANVSSSNEGIAPGYANMSARWYSANGTEVANNSNLAAEVVRVRFVGI